MGFQREVHLLKRIVTQFGYGDAGRMLLGAQALGWHTMRSLASKEGLGRRWALERYWQDQKSAPQKQLESVATFLKARGFS